MRSRVYGLLCALGVLTAPADSPRADGVPSKDASSANSAPTPRQWRYTIKIDGKLAPFTLVLVEAGRRQFAGRQVVDLAVEANGQRVAKQDLSWLPAAPFSYFGVKWSLLFGRDKHGRRVDLTMGPELLASAEFEKDPEASAAVWWLDSRGPSKHARVQPDEPYTYRTKVGAWQSVCMGYDHTCTEACDYFSWTRCFAPGIGVTRISFDSVWGSLNCELQSPPRNPSLP